MPHTVKRLNTLKSKAELEKLSTEELRNYRESFNKCPESSPRLGDRGSDMIFAKDHPLFNEYLRMMDAILSYRQS